MTRTRGEDLDWSMVRHPAERTLHVRYLGTDVGVPDEEAYELVESYQKLRKQLGEHIDIVLFDAPFPAGSLARQMLTAGSIGAAAVGWITGEGDARRYEIIVSEGGVPIGTFIPL